MPRQDTKGKLKEAAQQLFADKGIDAVGVREIVTAADQKNMASLHYYFGSKEDLVRELLKDASAVIENRRTLLLDQLEAAGGPKTASEILRIFIECAVIEDDNPRSLSNVRLFLMAAKLDPHLVLATVEDTQTSAYFRCLQHLRNFLSDLEPESIEPRLYLLQQYVFNCLASRERALSNDTYEAVFWRNGEMLNQLIQTAESLLFTRAGKV